MLDFYPNILSITRKTPDPVQDVKLCVSTIDHMVVFIDMLHLEMCIELCWGKTMAGESLFNHFLLI